MGFEMPKVPKGSGQHPITLVVISANDLAASGDFYSKLFGWQVEPMSKELAGVVTPGGPTAALRSNEVGRRGDLPWEDNPAILMLTSNKHTDLCFFRTSRSLRVSGQLN